MAEVDPTTGQVVVHEWLKTAILLLFRLRAIETIEVGPFEYADKLPLKHDYAAAGVRVVPGASARWGSFLGPGVISCPATSTSAPGWGPAPWSTPGPPSGSCAQIGERVHLSGGVGIGGVLEPPNAAPVIIEDDAMIGSRCMVTQGARVGRGAVLGEGTILNPPSRSSTPRPGTSSAGARAGLVGGRLGLAGGGSSPAASSSCPACW